MSEPVATFSASNLPGDPATWPLYQGTTPAIRVEGEFATVAPDGTLMRCSDGFLAVDPSGRPYPIDNYDFDRTAYIARSILLSKDDNAAEAGYPGGPVLGPRRVVARVPAEYPAEAPAEPAHWRVPAYAGRADRQ